MFLFWLSVGFVVAEQLELPDLSAIKSLVQPAQISNVSLYSDGAYIQRELRLNLSPGMYKVELRNLPEGIELSQLNVDLEGGKPLRIFSQSPSDFSEQEAIHQELLEAVNKNEYALELLLSEKLTVESDIRTLATAKAFNVLNEEYHEEEMKIYSETWSVSLEHLTARQRENNKKILLIEEKQQELKEEQKRIFEQVEEVLSPKSTVPGHVFLVFEQFRPSSLIQVSYALSGAEWERQARLVFDSQSSKMYIEQKALVAQKTGEDWTGVELLFYSGEMSDVSVRPKVQQRYFENNLFVPRPNEKDRVSQLNLPSSISKPSHSTSVTQSELVNELASYEAQERQTRLPSLSGEQSINEEIFREQLINSYGQTMSDARDKPEQAKQGQLKFQYNTEQLKSQAIVQLNQNQREADKLSQFVQVHQADSVAQESPELLSRVKEFSIDSGEAPLVLPLSKDSVEGSFYREIVPALELVAYLKFKPESPARLELSEGIAVFWDNRFRGELRSDHRTREGFEIPLGVDDRIRVNRTFSAGTPKRDSELSSVDYMTTIELVSEYDKPVKARVFEPMPLSLTPDVSFEVVASSHEHQHQQIAGNVMWELELQPNQLETVTFHYRMTHPQGLRIQSVKE